MNEDELHALLNPALEEISLDEFQRNPRAHIERLREIGRPALLSVDGEAEVVVQSAEAYRRLLELVDRAEAVIDIQRGLRDVELGDTLPIDEAFQEIREQAARRRSA